MKVVIIGGVAAGMSAASKLRRLNPQATLVVYEKGNDLSYGACGMPYVLSDVIEDINTLVARTVEDFAAQDITVHTQHEVLRIDPTTQSLRVRHGEKEFDDTYDVLIIGSGASAIRLPVPGADLKGLHVLNSLDDLRHLKSALDEAQTIAVIGGGFIGIEVIENLVHMGKDVHLIERLPHVLPQFDPAVTEHALNRLNAHGVHVHCDETLTHYAGTSRVTQVHTDKGHYVVDLVIEAIGVRPNTQFCEGTSIVRLANGAIVVDEQMRTSLPNIYATGDCVAYPHRLRKDPAFVPLGTHANKGGRVIAETIAGIDARFNGVISSGIVKVFEDTFAKTGLRYEEAIQEGYKAAFVDVKARNQAGYYPGATPIHMRLVYDRERCVLLGAQLVGEKGVSDRINILALAIAHEIKVYDIAQLDMAYSPPFSPVWDPIQVACNQIKCGQ